jgi:DNA-directed RNA polymerase specialized sigma24 family protein
VILMKETEDMQYHEIAEALGCSIGYRHVSSFLCSQKTAKSIEGSL